MNAWEGTTILAKCDARSKSFRTSTSEKHGQLFFGTFLDNSAFRSAIARVRSRAGIASRSRVRFGSFAVMIACAASISLSHSAWRNTSQRSTCTHCDRGNSTDGDTPSRSSSSAYRSSPAARDYTIRLIHRVHHCEQLSADRFIRRPE
jgi:hypothetical protein